MVSDVCVIVDSSVVHVVARSLLVSFIRHLCSFEPFNHETCGVHTPSCPIFKLIFDLSSTQSYTINSILVWIFIFDEFK